MKCSSEMLQNWPYIWNTKTCIVYFVFHFRATSFFHECPGQNIPGHLLGKNKGAQNEKTKLPIWFCSIYLEHFIKHKTLISEEW